MAFESLSALKASSDPGRKNKQKLLTLQFMRLLYAMTSHYYVGQELICVTFFCCLRCSCLLDINWKSLSQNETKFIFSTAYPWPMGTKLFLKNSKKLPRLHITQIWLACNYKSPNSPWRSTVHKKRFFVWKKALKFGWEKWIFSSVTADYLENKRGVFYGN